jgi:hypothetical protein
MFSVFGSNPVRTCAGLSRRELLRVGSLALGGLSLPGLLASHAHAANATTAYRDKAVVLLFLVGGPPQIETFDPKENVPENNKSCTGEVQTALAGVKFGGTFPKMGERADRLAVLRSFSSTEGDHQQVPLITGRSPMKAPMSAIVSRALGAMNPKTGVPTNTIIVPEAIRPDLKLNNPTGPFQLDYVKRNFVPAGNIGRGYDAFMPTGDPALMKTFQLQMAQSDFDDRQSLLGKLDTLKRTLDKTGETNGIDSFQRQAADVLAKGIADAFDLTKEDAKTIAKYDTSHCFKMEDYHRGGKNYNNLVNQSRATNLLGKQMLLARRLVERGAGFVTVLDSCWDFHGDGNNPPTPVGMKFLGPQLDHAVAAFLDDLKDRGLEDKVLLIVTGEMGRSPRKGNNGGTGHHADLSPLVLAGGGLKMGQVIGKSDKVGAKPDAKVYKPENLLATVLHTMFDSAAVRTNPALLPAEVANLVNTGQPISELF